MKLIVGLGNPGPKYEKTRHNAGFMALDRAVSSFAKSARPASKFGGALIDADVKGERTLFLKPLNFMNASGTPVAEALRFYKLAAATDLLVLVDDYNLPLGAIRIRESGSDGNHNGLTDVIRALGSPVFPRLRIGVDPKPPGYDDPADWVLSRFTDEDVKRLEPALDRTVQAIDTFIAKGTAAAMNSFNAPPTPPSPPKPKPAPREPSAAKSPATPATAVPSKPPAPSVPPAADAA